MGESTRLAVSGVATLEQGELEVDGRLSNLNTSDSIISVFGVCESDGYDLVLAIILLKFMLDR